LGGDLGRRLVATTALGLTLAFAPCAWAQSARPLPSRAQPSREQLNPERQAPPRQERARDLFSPPAALPCPLAGSEVTFVLQSVEIQGATLPAERLRPAYGDLIGKTIPVSDICEIRDRLSLILFRQGLLARVEAPAQTITSGRLKLVVVEAYIVSVRVRGDVGPAQDKVEAYLDKLRGLTPFDLRTAQRYLLLANEVPGVHISAALRPAAQGRGAIDLDIQVQREPFDVVAGVQNSGSDTLGPWSGLVRVDLNSFTRLGERTTLIAYRTLPDDEQWIVQLVEEARLGSAGLIAHTSVAYGRSRPGDVLKPLGLRGESLVVSGDLQYPLLKRKRWTLNLGGGLDVVDQKTTFPGGGVLSDDQIRVLWTALSADFLTPLLGERVLATGHGTLQLRKGLSILGASQPGDFALSRFEARPDAWVLRLEGDSQFAMRYAVVGLRVQAQYTRKPLVSYEEMAVGDLTVGRGYEPAVLTGDKVAGAELRLSPPTLHIGDDWIFTPYVFGDISRVVNLDTGSENRTLRSAGVGVDCRLPYGLRASLVWARPFDKPFPNQTRNLTDRVLVQLVVAR
jgi:hemolysin activation/secretion protein